MLIHRKEQQLECKPSVREICSQGLYNLYPNKRILINCWSPRLSYKTSGKGEDLSRVHFCLFNMSEANGNAEASLQPNLDALNHFLEESLAHLGVL